jgi:hypothetical protein
MQVEWIEQACGKGAAMPGVKREARSERRVFPHHPLETALVLVRKIVDDMAAQPTDRLLLAEALGIKPASSNYRDLLSSSNKYGLTEGSEKSAHIRPTPLGIAAVQDSEPQKQQHALRTAALKPDPFRAFLERYSNRKIPGNGMLERILATDFGIPETLAAECAKVLLANGQFTGLIRTIAGAPRVIFDDPTLRPEMKPPTEPATVLELEAGADSGEAGLGNVLPLPSVARSESAKSEGRSPENQQPKPIFLAHGKNRAPLAKLEKILRDFGIPYKIVMDEANLARPISQKVRDTMAQCGSAIVMFTRDEKLFDEEGSEVWRPSQNVVYELGAALYAYGQNVVILKEKGLSFASNYAGIGYIEFDAENIEAQAMDVIKELVGFKLLRIAPA